MLSTWLLIKKNMNWLWAILHGLSEQLKKRLEIVHSILLASDKNFLE